MALPILKTIATNARINFATGMQVGGVTRFKGYTFLGVQSFAVARTMQGQDPQALVAATRAYFRPGTETDVEKIEFVAVRADNTSPLMLIPEPLIQENSIGIVTKMTHTIRVEDEISREQLSLVLSSIGLTKYTINTEVT